MSEGELPKLSAKAGCLARVKRTLELSILISEKNPYSLQFYENLTTIRKLRMRQIATGSTIIHCFSDFRIYYEMWMAVIFSICLIHFPLQASFGGREVSMLRIFKLCVDCACVADIALRFRTAYVEEKEKRVITDPQQIAMKYLRTFFVPDLISTIPDPYTFGPGGSTIFLDILSLLCLFKLSRAATTYEYLLRSAQYLRIDKPICRTLLTAFFFILFCHWTACAVYLLPHFRRALTGQIDKDSWTLRERIFDESLEQRYFHTLYKASAYILAIKQQTVTEQAFEEKIFACVLYIVGKLVVFYITVMAVGKFLNIWSLESKYYEVVEELEGFMRRKQLSTATRNRLLQYYNYKFRRTYFEEHTIKSILSERLRQQINQNIMQKFIGNVEIFNCIPQETMNRIINHLHLEVFLPHDLIIKAGTVGEAMYFLGSGTVAVYTPSGKEVCHLQDGAHFGEIALLKKEQKRTAHVFAVEICEVYKLDKRSFNSYLRPVKELMDQMLQEANLRIEMTKDFEDIHIRDYKF
ncbi:potassium/sodium hyperpolarization-activated cyclic nucleotide-gated channel 1-like [Zophobas morio]|uniref:potassium/sodium hyperpolarization-activated cyclic nucleotide-gated channel 1-like n=1 Tax=Zophobas morio TaxID=2755281 RepID=UPI003083C5E1